MAEDSTQVAHVVPNQILVPELEVAVPDSAPERPSDLKRAEPRLVSDLERRPALPRRLPAAVERRDNISPIPDHVQGESHLVV